MTIRLRLRRPAPAVRKACKRCETRRSMFRQQGIARWDPYYALCYTCYQRHVSHAETAHRSPLAAEAAASRLHKTLALETGLMPAR